MFSKMSVRRPYTVLVGVILILILGYVSLTRMTADLLPNLELPYAVVVTTYPGASPETVETTLTVPIEESMATLSNIENVSSVSNENYSLVILQFAESTNMDSVSLDMREKLDQLESRWKDDLIGSPMIMKLNPNMMPIMVAGAEHADYDNAVELTKYMEEEILPELQSVEGVASVSVGGAMKEHISVILSQKKVDALNKRIHKSLDGSFEDAEKKIADAEEELSEGKQKLEDSKAELEKNTSSMGDQLGKGQSELTEQQSALMKNQTDLEKQLASVEEKLAELTKQKEDLEKQKKDLTEKKTELKAQRKELQGTITTLKSLPGQLKTVEKAIKDLEASKAQLEMLGDQGAEQLAAVNAQLTELYATKTTLEEQIAASADSLDQLTKGIAEIDAGLAQIDDGLKQINDGMPQLEDGIKQLEDAKTQLEDGLKQIKEGQATVKDMLSQLNASSISGSIQMAVGLSQINSGLMQIEDGEKQLENSKEELKDAKKAAYDSADMNDIVTTSLLSQLLTAQNFSMPAGYITENNEQILVRVGDKAESTEDLEKMVLMDLHMDDLPVIRLGDVADVVTLDNSDEVYANINGKPGILFTMEKQTGYSTGNVSKALAKRFERLEERYEGLHFVTLMDQGDYIEIIVKSVFSNLIFGAVLAMLILLIFLKDLRPTLIVAFSIPLSLLTCIVCMYFADISLNMISLSALALVVGMLVDNSIVVIENIYRMRNLGVPAKRAAVEGAKQVAGAITASTLTTVCVFLPIVFTEGITKQLFVDMGLTMGFALVASLFISLTLVPAMSAGLLKRTKEKPDFILGGIIKIYEKVLRWSLRFKPVVLILALAFLAGSMYLSISNGTALFPEMDGNQATITISVDEKQTFKDLAKAAKKLTKKVVEIEGVEDVGVSAGATGGSRLMSSLMGGGSSGNSANMYVILDENADFDGAKLEADIMKAAEGIDCTVEVNTNTMDMSMLASGVRVQVEARNLDTLKDEAEKIAKMLEGVEGVTNVDSGIGETTREFRITVNEKKAARYGLTTAQIFQAISEELAEDSSATTLSTASQDYEVFVEDGNKVELTRKKLKNLKLKGTDKDKKTVNVKLKKVATFKKGYGMHSIHRQDQSRYLSVTAEIADGYNVGLVSQDVNKMMNAYEAPEGVSWKMDGENEYINDAFGQVLLMLILAVAFMYLIMVAQFQSLLSPFIILFTIPLAFTGGFFGLFVAGDPISLIAMVGFVLLSGVIVNNGIVMVDYINQLRYTGMEKREAIIEAGKTRLRPILMTALTTILAMSTMMFGNDLGVALGKPMTVVSIGGLLYGTLLTLIVVPCIYDIFNRKKEIKDPLAELDNFEEA